MLFLDLLQIFSDYWIKPMIGLGVVLLVLRKPHFRSAAFMHAVFLLSLFAVLFVTLMIPTLPEFNIKVLPAAWVEALHLPLAQTISASSNWAWLYGLMGIYLFGVSWCASYTFASWREAAKLSLSAKRISLMAC